MKTPSPMVAAVEQMVRARSIEMDDWRIAWIAEGAILAVLDNLDVGVMLATRRWRVKLSSDGCGAWIVVDADNLVAGGFFETISAAQDYCDSLNMRAAIAAVRAQVGEMEPPR